MLRPEYDDDFVTTVRHLHQTETSDVVVSEARMSPKGHHNSQQLPATERPIGRKPSRRSRNMARTSLKSVVLASLSAAPVAMADCISLQGSKTCSAFESSSISTDSFLVGLLYVLSSSERDFLEMFFPRLGLARVLSISLSRCTTRARPPANPHSAVLSSSSFRTRRPLTTNCDPTCKRATSRKSEPRSLRDLRT